MKPAPVEYVAVDSIEQAVEALAGYGEEAKILAGGQSLIPMLNMRLAQPGILIDVSRLEPLRGVSRGVGSVRYGAAVTHSRFEDGEVPDAGGGLMARAAQGIGYRAVRNRGTIGGSLAHADASAEWPVVLSALNATVHVRSARGTRELPATTFVRGFFTSALEDDELIVEIEVAEAGPDHTWGCTKFARKDGEFAESFAVAVLRWSGDRVEQVELWLGAARGVPLRIQVEGTARSGADSVADKVRLADALGELLGPPRTAEERFRLNLHATTLSRALRQALRQRSADGDTG